MTPVFVKKSHVAFGCTLYIFVLKIIRNKYCFDYCLVCVQCCDHQQDNDCKNRPLMFSYKAVLFTGGKVLSAEL